MATFQFTWLIYIKYGLFGCLLFGCFLLFGSTIFIPTYEILIVLITLGFLFIFIIIGFIEIIIIKINAKNILTLLQGAGDGARDMDNYF